MSARRGVFPEGGNGLGTRQALVGGLKFQKKKKHARPPSPDPFLPSSPSPPPALRSMKVMYEHVNERNGKWSPLLADDVYEIIKEVRAAAIPPPHSTIDPPPRRETFFWEGVCLLFALLSPFFQTRRPRLGLRWARVPVHCIPPSWHTSTPARSLEGMVSFATNPLAPNPRRVGHPGPPSSLTL